MCKFLKKAQLIRRFQVTLHIKEKGRVHIADYVMIHVILNMTLLSCQADVLSGQWWCSEQAIWERKGSSPYV
jgi:hypothetical protein